MRAPAFLALRTLGRNPIRTVLVLLGLAVTGALLLDMTMLAHGLETSLGGVLSRVGFAVRVVPKGTLPFVPGAMIPDGDGLAAAIAAQPGVTAAVPVVGTNIFVARRGRRTPAFVFAVPAGGTGAYGLLEGRDLPPAAGSGAGGRLPAVVVNPNMVRLDGVRIGDTLVLAAGPSRGLAPVAAPRTFRVTGVADFYIDLATQRSMAIATADLRALEGRPSGAASLILVRLGDPSRAGALTRWIGARDPRVDALSIADFLGRLQTRLTYFNQFSLVLGSLSVAVSFLLITAIVALSVSERLGEIAMLRAIGFTRARIAALVVLEGSALGVASLPGTFALGLVIAGYLDTILRGAPGLPVDLHFFVLTPGAAARTVALVLGTGTVAGVYPAAVASRTPVAATLHAEVLS
ncbi:MAG TPA: FtsX-like permease family protein [bacterium]|nr:FtsX-like permease family protein [bacterium]